MTEENSKSIVHEFLHVPPKEAILWRYMDFVKFISLLETNTLFFARADKLGDPFEGSFPKKNATVRTTLTPRLSVEDIFKYAHVTQHLTRFTLVSCWHESEYESESMWNRYANENSGIAIRTCADTLSRSFLSKEQIHIGRVQYVDYDTDTIPEDNGLIPYLYKRKSFESEREVRAIIQRPPAGIDITQLRSSIQQLSLGEIGEWKDFCDIGYSYEVNLEILIEEVLVARLAPDWFLQLVQQVAKRYGLEAPINRSVLADTPSW